MNLNYRFFSMGTLVDVSSKRLKEIFEKDLSTLSRVQKANLSNELGEMYNSLSTFKSVNPEIQQLATMCMEQKVKIADSDVVVDQSNRTKRVAVQQGNFSSYHFPWMNKGE
ncbi:hypothetical protein [Neobacillus sp. PS2-9]|uniref:hypothetical protein n=1 Tax=Neobacillus sp. PS2-9 TaxID=3070676 RepID=UPI0027E1D575|nr:hypothetical protein [Neobacillus sp. PS2-9]WML58553.1 hypothetical protein RCG25_01810 [Neobacillus sp. PS2-9]